MSVLEYVASEAWERKKKEIALDTQEHSRQVDRMHLFYKVQAERTEERKREIRHKKGA